jgi:hypothetical protein
VGSRGESMGLWRMHPGRLLGTSPSKETVGAGAAEVGDDRYMDDATERLLARFAAEHAQPPIWGEKGNPFGDFCRRTDAGPPPSRRVGERPDTPVVEVVLDLDRATLEGVAVWNAADKKVRVTTPLDTAVRETFADTVAEAVVGELLPAHAASPALAHFDTALTAVKGVLEPQILFLKMINAAARVAAGHTGFGAVAPLIGQFAEDLCKQYVRPPRDEIAEILNCIDIDLYAAAGDLPYSPFFRQLTEDEMSHGIEKLFTDRFWEKRDRGASPRVTRVSRPQEVVSRPEPSRIARRGNAPTVPPGSRLDRPRRPVAPDPNPPPRPPGPAPASPSPHRKLGP